MRFWTRREQKNARKVIFLEMMQTARDLENVGFLFVFPIDSAMSHFGRTKEIATTERAARLQTGIGSAQENTLNSSTFADKS